ncbi:hypothetical protein Tco_1167396 [Tanacetum coccineum]
MNQPRTISEMWVGLLERKMDGMDEYDHHDDAHLEGENIAKRQKTSEHGTFVFGESSSHDDVLPNEKVSQELVDEMSQTVDEAKLRKVFDEMLRQQCTSGDEHHCQRDPKAPALSLVNQDLLYLKKGNTGPEKIALSLHKFPIVRFPDNDIEERTSRWVMKCGKKFNPYARYNIEHGKNSHAKIFNIRKQQEPRNPKKKRANGCIVSTRESDYKNLNKNDIEDMYLLIIVPKVDYYAETGLLWSLLVFIRSTMIWERVHDFQLGIEKYKVFSIVYELVYGIIYKNSKKEKRVMRHQEVHKFCDATLKRVLEGLKSYNNNVKYGYVTHYLSKEDVEYLQLFAKELKEQLKYHDQMRR